MIEGKPFRREEISTLETIPGLKRSRVDLLILCYMARKLNVTLRTLEQPFTTSLPLSYSFEERRGRTHRMILYAPQKLLTRQDLRFVGFVSKRSTTVDRHIIDEIFRVDQCMLHEIACVPGLLSYSSLELRPGFWYNLVIFDELTDTSHVRTLELHRYAAHQLSPAYYEWIRLHNGNMSGGLASPDLRLKSTRYYLFTPEQQQTFIIHTYDDLYRHGPEQTEGKISHA